MNKRYTIEDLKELDITNISRVLYDSLNEFEPYRPTFENAIWFAFVLWIASVEKDSSNQTLDFCSVEAFEDAAFNSHESIFGRVMNDAYYNWDLVTRDLYRYDEKELAAFILFCKPDDKYEEKSLTPDCVIRLANSILMPEKDDYILDMSSGYGEYSINTATSYPETNYVGIELDSYKYEISNIRFSVFRFVSGFDGTGRYIHKSRNWFSGFSYYSDGGIDVYRMDFNEENREFDRVFSNNLKIETTPNIRYSQNRIAEEFGLQRDELKKVSSDWIICLISTTAINEKGRIAMVMSLGSLKKLSDRPAREYLIKNGLIEKIVVLPNRLFPKCIFPTAMVVISRGNKKVSFYDASNMGEMFRSSSGRLSCRLTDENIDKITSAFVDNDSKAIHINNSTIEEKLFSLDVRKLMSDDSDDSNMCTLADIVYDVKRGIQIKAKELDEYYSPISTGIQYITPSNIKNGILDLTSNPTYLDWSLPKKFSKYYAHSEDILLNKIGSPIKTAIVPDEGSNCLVVNGNLYVISIKHSLANPYYVAAFLESDAGADALNSITTGGIIGSVSIEELLKMKIPLPEKEIQDRVAKKYKDILEETIELQKKFEATVQKRRNVFSNEI